MADVAVDYGRARTGFAICVAGVIMPAEPLVNSTWEGIAGRLESIARENGEGTVVLGLPLTPSGRPTELCGEVEKLAEFLRGKGYRVELQRETSSTEEALSGKGSSGGRDGRKDSLAAMVILRRYLGQP